MVRLQREGSAGKGRRSPGRGAGGGVRRTLGMLALLPLASRAPLYARLIWALVLDDRTPAAAKAALAAGLGYVVLGRDLIPDEIPVLGGLDDLVVVAIAIDVFLDGIDEDVIDEKLAELGIERAAFDEDIARIRRFLPGPIRRAARRRRGHCSNPVSAPDFGPGSPGRNRTREGHPDEGRGQARQVGRDEDRGRWLRHELPPQPETRGACGGGGRPAAG